MAKLKKLFSSLREVIANTAERTSISKSRATMRAKMHKLDRANKLKGEKRRIAKMRPWLARRGKNKHGYQRAKLEYGKGVFVRIKVNGKTERKRVWFDPDVAHGKPVAVFFNAKENRFIFVRKYDGTPIPGKIDLSFEAFSVVPGEKTANVGGQDRFITAYRRLIPEKNVSSGGSLHWGKRHHTEGETSGKTEAPEFIRRQGFGLYMDFLRDAETKRLGIKKVFGLVYQKKRAPGFAEKRGFKKPSGDERKLYENLWEDINSIPEDHVLRARDL